MNDVQDLIARLRAGNGFGGYVRQGLDAAEALEAQHASIAELEAERDEFLEQRNEYIGFEKESRAERDALAAAIEKVRVAATEEFTWQQFGSAVDRILATAPADLLRQHDADVWDAAQTPVAIEPGTNPSTALPPNPYRVKPEGEWVDPEPWFYPATGVRTAHKLAQTNAEYRPRTVKPEDER